MDGEDSDKKTMVDGQRFADIITTFLSALFRETDHVLFRPIETWTEAGHKHSQVIHTHTKYFQCAADLVRQTLPNWVQLCSSKRANAFFGICPRFGNGGRYDLAWQIRTVRCLWSDIDHIEVEQALEWCREKNLPPPSIAINSGNGAHLYWLLEEPYLIDDVGDPPPVLTEWVQTPDGRKKPRKYILEGDERTYLDKRHHTSRLSPKAQHIQDVLAGIAVSIGGDHTTDLSRLLRVPGTLNRKDERNGRAPVETALVACDPNVRYAIADFEKFAQPAPETTRRQQIELMPLPSPRKLSGSRQDKMSELIAASRIAPAGSRSEADFALCCFAIRNGISREDLWSQVQTVGKFAEQGERYFQITWEKAEYDVRAGTFEKIRHGSASPGKKSRSRRAIAFDDDKSDEKLGSECARESDDDRPTIEIDPSTMTVGTTMRQISDRLLATGDCYERASQLVVIRNQTIAPILSSRELSGFLNTYVEFFFVDGETGGYKPLPASYGNTWLNHLGQRERFPAIKMFSHNPVYTEDWRRLEPGFDPPSKIYYCGPPVAPLEGTDHLDRLLQDFCFKTPADRTNYLGLLLTPLLMPRFIGSKPAVLFNGNQPELGKSILAQIIAILRDGSPVVTVTYIANDEEFEKRLGSVVQGGATTIIIDNAKAGGRNPRIDSACLERSITDPILSFRLLGFSRDIRAENSHIFCVTANTPDVSRDLITRSVVINLQYEGNPLKRSFSILDPEGFAEEHRLAILGELIGMVERWKAAGMPLSNAASRFNKRGWAKIIGGILEANNEPDFLSNAESAATELDETRREFAELVAAMAEHEQGTWTGGELVSLATRHGLLRSELGESTARSQATRMGVLAGRFIAERFESGDCTLVFHRSVERKGNVYRVEVIDKVPNLGHVAGRLPNLSNTEGSAP